MLGSIAEAYKRWRHTRGYGVHSPFAYTVVREVIRPGRHYAYYGYSDIDNAVESHAAPHTRRMAKTLLRLAAFARVRRVYIPRTPDSTVYLTALKAADSRISIVSAMQEAGECTLVCSHADFIPLDTLIRLMRSSGRVLAVRDLPEGWADRLFAALDEGVMFHGRKNILIFSRTGMQKVAYSIII